MRSADHAGARLPVRRREADLRAGGALVRCEKMLQNVAAFSLR
jgi:hypothetical protein